MKDRLTQTRWIVAPNHAKAAEFSVKRAKDLATTYDAGLRMLAKSKTRACWNWRLYQVRFTIEVEEEKG
jgi:hypothetical protein